MRLQYSGSDLLASCTRSATLIVADWTAVLPDARVPRSRSRNCQLGSVSIAEPMPEEAAAVVEVVLEAVALRVGERAGEPRVQEHDGAVGLQLLGGELVADISRARRDDGEPGGLAGRLDGGDAGVPEAAGACW